MPKTSQGRTGARKGKRKGKGGKPPYVDPEVFALARARGATLAQAAALAGSRARSWKSLSNVGVNLQAQPEVKARILELRETIAEDLDSAWEAACRWARGILTGTIEATNMDRQNAATWVGRVLGRFVERKDIHVEVHHLPYQSVLPEGEVIGRLPEGASGKIVDVDGVELLPAEGTAEAVEGGETPSAAEE